MPSLSSFIYVALGGAVGAALRYGVVSAATTTVGAAFPFGALTVNVVGSGAMGLAAAAIVDRASPAALLLMTGVLGGFTTFSAYALDAVALYERGRAGAAVGYAALSVVGSIAALVAGLALGRWLWGR